MLIAGLILGGLTLIFILQNLDVVSYQFLFWTISHLLKKIAIIPSDEGTEGRSGVKSYFARNIIILGGSFSWQGRSACPLPRLARRCREVSRSVSVCRPSERRLLTL